MKKLYCDKCKKETNKLFDIYTFLQEEVREEPLIAADGNYLTSTTLEDISLLPKNTSLCEDCVKQVQVFINTFLKGREEKINKQKIEEQDYREILVNQLDDFSNIVVCGKEELRSLDNLFKKIMG